MAHQQPLHQLVTSVAAPTLVLSRPSGDFGSGDLWPAGGEGIYHADQRVLAVGRLTVDGRPPVALAHHARDGHAVFSSLALVATENPMQDPQLRIDRRRVVTPGTVREELTVSSMADEESRFTLELRLGTDGASMSEVRAGDDRELVPHDAREIGGGVQWTRGEATYRLAGPGAIIDLVDPTMITLRWLGTLAPHATTELAYNLECDDPGGAVVAARGEGLDVAGISERLVEGTDPAVREAAADWLTQSLHDLNGLRMATAARPDDAFFAAGSPWYLTLFGRDSLWTARFLVGVDLAHAASTLRTLAALQGTKDDPEAAEQPGKIMHELRRATLAYGSLQLPPLYFGTIDATALWVCLLVDAWRAGLPEAEVRALLPNLRAALAWITGPADADGDGFAEYIDTTGHGLANQGWKDSADAVRFHDGRQAVGPVALCEVQGYAYEAVMGAAELLDALGGNDSNALRASEDPNALRASEDPHALRASASETRSALHETQTLRDWAHHLRERFHDQFWVGEGDDRFVALALDGDKRPVDSVTSNMGHLIGTGILSPDEERLLARRLVADDMASPLGLRTMSDHDQGYSPLSYHCGSVWPHDTAVVIMGMLRAGLTDEAGVLARGLLRAARSWDNRLPELWSGEDAKVPYPAACRPQAWSAAAAVVAVRAL
ncbi:glycogen debranching N-terminal domain-containing protein [Mariniluteicoccus flavus]